MRVAVLGCGPAGLMAAHGARMAGADVQVFSRKQKSPMYGAQYLHHPIPGVTESANKITVEYRLMGSVSEYRRKVYGKMWDGTVSVEDLESTHPAWDIRETYDRLWAMYADSIENFELDPAGVFMLYNNDDIDLMINTIPMPALCSHGHQFRATEVIAAGDAPGLGIDVGKTYRCTPDTVLLNGKDHPSWYRISNIFGHTTVEWPEGIEPPIGSASKVTKPTETNCNCFPRMFRVGRYGAWRKGVLSHTAYFQSHERVERMIADEQAQPSLFKM